MPQVIVKGLAREETARLAPAIAETVAQAISAPREWIVVEHNEVAFFRGGKVDPGSVFALIQWKRRTPELQKLVSERLAGLFFAETGCASVEVLYDNLDMSDFYEYKADEPKED